jgi:hypothetical protein
MVSCEHLQRTSMYFDGELPPGEERDATDHIATCEHCQTLLGDAVGLDAVLSRAKPAASVPITPRRRWQIALGAAALVGAAAIAIVVLRPKPRQHSADRHDRVALVLPPARSLEVRFTGDAFAAYRPYEIPRERAHEAIDVRALTDLEARGQTRDLVAALASKGELVRASEVARKTLDAASLSDLAAIALAGGDAEGALGYAYQALDQNAELAAARWNLALAARQLKLWRVSRTAFAAIAARAEPGWANEARQHVALVDRELGRPGEIARLKSQFELLVKAGSVRNTVTDPALRDDPAEFARRSRSILEDETPIELALVRRFPSHALQFLAASLASATPAIIEGLQPVARRLDMVSSTKVATMLIADRRDPFAAVTAFDDTCKNDIYALPCVPLGWRRAREQQQAGALTDAEQTALAARDLALGESIAVDYALLAELHRAQGRAALARAETEEATPGSR